MRTASFLTAMAILAASALADAVTDAADQVTASFRAKADLSVLAAKEDPDPWLVADELCARGEHDAAEAFAKAAPRKNTERLPGYVAVQRSKPTEAGAREVLRSMNAAFARKDGKAALQLLEGITPRTDVTSIRLLYGRGLALRGARDLEDSGQSFRAAAEQARKLGWLAHASLALHEAGVSAYLRADWKGALDAWEERLRLAEVWGHRSAAAATLGNIGVIHDSLGDYPKALSCQERALKLKEELGDRAGIAATVGNIGYIHQRRGDHPKALSYQERALKLHEELGDRAGIATTLGNIGLIHESLGDHAQAMSYLERALTLREELGDPARIAGTLGDIGNILLSLGNYPKALSYQERALKLKEELGNRAGIAATVGNIGNLYDALGDYAKALSFHERALKLQEEVGDRAGVALTLGNIGVAYLSLGDFRKALSYHERALKLKEELGDRAGIAQTLGNIGNVYKSLGDYSTALSYQERSLKLNEELGDRAGVSRNLTNIGNVYSALGDFRKALSYQEQSLRMKEGLGDRAGVALTLGNIGNTHASLGDYPTAMSCLEQSLKLREEIGNRAGIAGALGSIGAVHRLLGDFREALSYLGQSLKLMEEIGDRAGITGVLSDIGLVYRSLGQYARALSYQERALKLAEDLGDRAGAASVLHNIGSIHWSIGDYASALSYAERALKLQEEVGDRAAVAGILGDIGVAYWSLGDFRKALSHQERALRLMEELGNGAGIATTLGNMGATHGSLGDYSKALSSLEHALKLMEGLGDREGAAVTIGDIGGIYVSLRDYPKALEHFGRALDLARSLASIDLEVRWLWKSAAVQAATGHPREAASAARTAVERMSGLVKGLADEQGATVREQFGGVFETGIAAGRALGDRAEVAFFLESGRAGTLLEGLALRDRLEAVVLPEDLRTAEVAARSRERVALNRYRQATERGEEVDALWKEVEAAQGAVLDVIARIRREAKAQAGLLYPEADSLPSIQGALGETEALVLYALLERESLALVVTSKDARIVPLGDTEKIAKAAEAFQKAVVRPDERGMAAPPHETFEYLQKRLRTLVVEPLGLDKMLTRLLVSPDGLLCYVPFATLCDVEVAYAPSGTTYRLLKEEGGQRGEGVLALGDPDYSRKPDPAMLTVLQRGEGLAPLAGSRDEATAVGDVILLGREATVPDLEAALKKRTRWHAVHLACHGLVDPERPVLSTLALTPTGEHDGFLKCLDVYQMRIPSDLVVLSACETAKGKVYRTEGVMGWTRAFMFAGAPRVIVSLWKVDDEATKTLMLQFYEEWKTKPATKALKAAQQQVRSQAKWQHPYFWAAWQLWGLAD